MLVHESLRQNSVRWSPPIYINPLVLGGEKKKPHSLMTTTRPYDVVSEKLTALHFSIFLNKIEWSPLLFRSCYWFDLEIVQVVEFSISRQIF